jgi:hypothetical protein
MYKYGNLGDTFYFQFPVNDANGSGADGSTPSAKVRLGGDSASAVPTYTATPYLLTNASYTDGSYEVAIPATTGNGFVINGDYGIFANIAVSSQNPNGFIGGLKLSSILADVTKISTQVALNQIASGVVLGHNYIIPSDAPSGSINYIYSNLTTEDTFFADMLNTVITPYQTLNTIGKSFNNIASGSLQASTAPTVTQIRQEIDSNSTQLSALTTRLSSARGGYLDNLSSGLVASKSDSQLQQSNEATLLSRLSSLRAGYLDNLSAGAIALNTDMSTLLSRLSLTRAGYLDNLSSGVVATQSQAVTQLAVTNAIKAITDQINFNGTKINAFTNDSSGVITLLNRVIGTIAAGTHVAQTGNSYPIVSDATYGNAGIQADVASLASLQDSIYDIAHKLDTTLELDGSVYQFTSNALLNSPVVTGGFLESDRTNLNASSTMASILNTMIENVGGNRYKAKALEQSPLTNVSMLATSSGLIDVSNKVDSVTLTANSILEYTETTGVKVQDVETGLSFVHAMQGLFALVCKMNGGGTNIVNARNYLDEKNRVTWSLDSNKNRLTVSFNFD